MHSTSVNTPALSDPAPADPATAGPAEASTTPEPPSPSWDDLQFVEVADLAPGSRWSRWNDLPPLARAPKPWPDWVITGEAVETDLGVIKSGKEATCFLLERTSYTPDGEVLASSWLVGKYYREAEHSMFHRRATYSEGRVVRNTRDARAMAKNTQHGRSMNAAHWSQAEWEALVRLHGLGVPVPYPVQIDGVELLMEYICDVDGSPADRLAAIRCEPDELQALWKQLYAAMVIMVEHGLVHGDLSPYNILVADPGTEWSRIVIIDVPQLVDLVANPNGFDLLHLDCVNVVTWFNRRGLAVDADEVFAGLLALAF